jgi:hypothetical protein
MIVWAVLIILLVVIIFIILNKPLPGWHGKYGEEYKKWKRGDDSKSAEYD